MDLSFKYLNCCWIIVISWSLHSNLFWATFFSCSPWSWSQPGCKETQLQQLSIWQQPRKLLEIQDLFQVIIPHQSFDILLPLLRFLRFCHYNRSFHYRCMLCQSQPPTWFLYHVNLGDFLNLGWRWNPTHSHLWLCLVTMWQCNEAVLILCKFPRPNRVVSFLCYYVWSLSEKKIELKSLLRYTNLIKKFFLVTFIILLLCKEYIQWNVFFVTGVLIQKGQKCNFTPSKFIVGLSCKKLHELQQR